MGTWQLQDAKAKLSEVIATAKTQGPQIITQRGIETAVVVPIDEWRRVQPKKTLLEVLRSGPEGDLPIPPRSEWRWRKLEEL